ncbi:hypothetical protein BGZ67_005808 [Mortierella alpina]|nr:hypothetical protein BGZ67_005808 [Mortierella alpina]
MSDQALATACDFRSFLSSVEAFYETKRSTPRDTSSGPPDTSSAAHPPDEVGTTIYHDGTAAASQASNEDMSAGLFHDAGKSAQTPTQTLARTLPPEANVSKRYEQDEIKRNSAEPLTALCGHDTDRDAADDRGNEEVIYRYSREFLILFRSHGISPSTMGGISAVLQQAAATKSFPQAQVPKAYNEFRAPEVTYSDDSFARESHSKSNLLSRSVQAHRSTGSATGSLSGSVFSFRREPLGPPADLSRTDSRSPVNFGFFSSRTCSTL